MQALQFSVTIPQWIALKTIGKFSRKAFYKGPLATLKLVDRSSPELPSNQWVKIKTLMCGFCASDLNLIFLKDSPSASPFTSFPCVIGHEICGQVAETGSDVTHLAPGDLVTIAPALSCVARGIDPPCRACRNDMFAGCENYAGGSLAPGMITGLCTDTAGGFAPEFVAHKSQLFKLPNGFSVEQGALIEPLSVGMQAVFGNLPQSGERVLIIGGGVIGTMILKTIRGLDLDCHVTVADPSSFAVQAVKKNGADAVINGRNLMGETVRLTSAQRHKPIMGPDILMGGFARIYDTVGSSATLNTAMRCLETGGTLSQVGIGHDVKLDLTPLWLKLQTLKGVYGCGVAEYNGRQRHMFDIAISMVNEGKLILDGMVSHAFTLQDFDKMIEVNLEKEKHKAVKTVVSFKALLNN
jgi:(R,R)-butanediol dehydrogenase/meso-butanediol dehydrogenase/diacetyl reductase